MEPVTAFRGQGAKTDVITGVDGWGRKRDRRKTSGSF